MAEERDHILPDTEEDTETGKRRGHLMRKEEEHAEAEERPVYPITSPEITPEQIRHRKIRKKKKSD
ncbi:MAG: hypothetical protein K6T91_04230 [Firmicutes bacterium]|nr:hypothetical protein [Bacillota bacterium]